MVGWLQGWWSHSRVNTAAGLSALSVAAELSAGKQLPALCLSVSLSQIISPLVLSLLKFSLLPWTCLHHFQTLYNVQLSIAFLTNVVHLSISIILDTVWLLLEIHLSSLFILVYLLVFFMPALIKKKIKFSSYRRKFRVEHAVAKFYMRKCVNISPYMRRPLVIYDFATDPPFWISLHMRKVWFSFLSVCLLSSILSMLLTASFFSLISSPTL